MIPKGKSEPIRPRTDNTMAKRLFMVYAVKCHFQQYFSYIVAVSFIGGVSRENHLSVASH